MFNVQSKLSLIALLLTATVSAMASDFVKDGVYYTYDIDAMTARVCICDDYDNPPSGDIVIPAAVPEYFTNRVHANAILYVPQEYLSAYENAATWKRFFDIRPIAEDAVGAIAADSRAAERYDLSGRRLPAIAAPHGLSIIRQADGSARKVLIR